MPQPLDVPFAPLGEVDAPSYAHPGDAGADLTSRESLTLEPGERALVSTGVSIALPEGYAAFVVPRSGLATKHGITVVNSPGTIDAGYRGEIKVTLLNTDPRAAFEVGVGDRIAQLIVMPVVRARFVPVETLPESVRGAGGFGSTGTAAFAASTTTAAAPSTTAAAPTTTTGASTGTSTTAPADGALTEGK